MPVHLNAGTDRINQWLAWPCGWSGAWRAAGAGAWVRKEWRRSGGRGRGGRFAPVDEEVPTRARFRDFQVGPCCIVINPHMEGPRSP